MRILFLQKQRPFLYLGNSGCSSPTHPFTSLLLHSWVFLFLSGHAPLHTSFVFYFLRLCRLVVFSW